MSKKISNNIIVYSFMAIICFWLIEAIIDYCFFYNERFQDVLLKNEHERSFRLLITVCFLIFAIIINKVSPARKRAEKELIDSEERYRSLVECTDDSIYVVDRDCRYLFINKKHLSRLNLREDQYKGTPFSELHSPKDTKWFVEIVNRVLESGTSIQHEHKNSIDNKFFILTFSPVRTNEGQITAVTIISKEITRIKSMEEKLYALSITDELTGLYNRRGFFTLAQHQLKIDRRCKKRTFLLYADMDSLKEINDTLGHAEGDIALISFANILKATYRESDTIGRIGGDEFVIYPVGTTEDNAATIASRLQNNINIYNEKRKHKFRLSVSLGIVPCDPGVPCSIEGLLDQADKLMYGIKKQKRESHFPSVIIS